MYIGRAIGSGGIGHGEVNGRFRAYVLALSHALVVVAVIAVEVELVVDAVAVGCQKSHRDCEHFWFLSRSSIGCRCVLAKSRDALNRRLHSDRNAGLVARGRTFYIQKQLRERVR
jgi:hypothetical protein